MTFRRSSEIIPLYDNLGRHIPGDEFVDLCYEQWDGIDDSLKDHSRIVKAADIITKGPWVDVRAFGAKGDGITDDTAAIQAAIDSLGNGGTIILPSRHKITTINMKTGLIVKGVSQYNSGFITTSAKAINFPNNTYYCSLSDFGIWGNMLSTTGLFFDGGLGGGIADIKISDVYVTNCLTGIYSTYAWSMVFQRVRLQNVKTGWSADTQSNQISVIGCSFNVTKQAVTLGNCEAVTFFGCEFSGTAGHDGTTPFTMFQSSGVNTTGCYYEGFLDNSTLYLIGASVQPVACRGIVFSGNQIAHNASKMFDLYGVDGFQFTGNKVSGLTYLFSDANGKSDNLLVNGNNGIGQEIGEENFLPNWNFFAYSGGYADGWSGLAGVSGSQEGVDGSYQFDVTNGTGIYTGGGFITKEYLTLEIECKSSVINTVFLQGYYDGAYNTIGSFDIDANTYTKRRFYAYVPSKQVVYIKILFSSAATINIKTIKGCTGIRNFPQDRTVKRLSSIAPTKYSWVVGDVVYNAYPAANGYMGWVCVTAGTPGTWKGFGAIQS